MLLKIINRRQVRAIFSQNWFLRLSIIINYKTQKPIDETLQQLSDVLVKGCEYEGTKRSFLFSSINVLLIFSRISLLTLSRRIFLLILLRSSMVKVILGCIVLLPLKGLTRVSLLTKYDVRDTNFKKNFIRS